MANASSPLQLPEVRQNILRVTPTLPIDFTADEIRLTAVIGPGGDLRDLKSEHSIAAPSRLASIRAAWTDSAFRAGTLFGRPTIQEVAIRLIALSGQSALRVAYPVASVDSRYWRSYAAHHGYRLPAIERFPSYFMATDTTSVESVPPHAVMRVIVDSTGGLIANDLLWSVAMVSPAHLVSASLYADFATGRWQGTAVADTAWIVVIHPQAGDKPVPAWTATGDNGVSAPLEAWRLQVLPDTSLLLWPPLPRSPSLSLSLDQRGSWQGRERVAVRVDTLGRARMLGQDPSGGVLGRLVDDLSFWPARRFDGSAVSFDGVIDLEFHPPRMATFRPRWLDPEP